MRFTYLFFSFLLCLSAVAQPNPINRRAMAITGLASGGNSDIPSSILSISNRWMSVHFASNAVSIADWPDETNSFHMITRASASSTTNSSDGMWLDGSHCFNATNTFRDPTMVQFWIFKNKDGLQNANRVLFQDTGVGLGYGFIENNAVTPQTAQWGINNPNPQLNLTSVPTNVFMNCVWTGSGGHLYTNGVDAGAPPGEAAASGTISVGGFDVPNHGWNGVLREWISFTNKTITASQISNLNYYATHYPYTNP